MEAIVSLKVDHERIRDLFNQISQAQDPTEREQFFDLIKSELETHTRIEEALLYPMLVSMPDFARLIEQSYLEHAMVKQLLADIDHVVDDTHWNYRITQLVSLAEHHFQVEEETLFSKMVTQFTESELTRMGDKIAQMRSEMSAEAA